MQTRHLKQTLLRSSKMRSFKNFVSALGLSVLAVSSGSAQIVVYEDEQPKITLGAVPGTLDMNWFGHSGRVYFIKYSPTLATGSWTYLPIVERGTDAMISYGANAPGAGDRFFARTVITASASTQPRFADFDNDGVSNMDELQAGLDPLVWADSDQDGMPDDWERFYFGDLSRNGSADFDGDGVNDADEYTAGRHPNTAIQYGTLKFLYAGNGPAANVVYMTDFNEENSLTVTYTDSSQKTVSNISVHLGVKWFQISGLAGTLPTMASYTAITTTDGIPTLRFDSYSVYYGSRNYEGLDLLRKIDGMPYTRKVTNSGVINRVLSYLAITSKSLEGLSSDFFPAIIRDFPYGSPEFIDFGRPDNSLQRELDYVQSQLGADGLPVSTLTDTSLTRIIYSAASFAQWYRNPDVLSLNMEPKGPLNSGWYGFIMANEFPFTKLTSSAGGDNNQFCWTTEIHAKLDYDVSPESTTPTKISVDPDDDMWVFINGKLIIKRPGIAGGYQEITLRDVNHGLVGDTGTADIAIFHAERREGASNVSFQTSSPLKPVYVYQVVADSRMNNSSLTYTLDAGELTDKIKINASSGKVYWDYSGLPFGLYSFTVEVSDSLKNTDSQSTTLIIGSPPVFTSAPASQEVAVGDSVTFSALASGYPAPTYQWYQSGVLIPGATSNSYTIQSTTDHDYDSIFTVVAKNAVGNSAKSAYLLNPNY